jgi:hypothetical protein
MTMLSLRRHSKGLGLSPRRSRQAGAAPPGDTEAPSIPQNLVATAVSSSQIDLSWDASTDDVGVAGYRIYRDNVLVHTSPTNAYADTGLDPGTEYEYEVSAIDGVSNASARSTPDSATTQASADTEAPSVPQNLVATAVSSSQIDLTCAASTDNIAVTGYNIYRDNVLVDTSPTNAYADTGLAPGTLYQYEVSAFDAAANESARSTPDSATTQQGIVTAGLIAEWRVDEGAGQQIADHSGNGHHATLGTTGGVDASDPAWQASPAALSFDGGDQALTSSIVGPTEFEVDLLLYGDSSCQAFGMVFVPHASASFDSQATTQIFKNGSNATLIYRVKGNLPGETGSVDVFDNAWHIVQAWSDGANIAAAVDGVEDVAATALGTSLTSSTDIVGIGARASIAGPSLGMTGKLAYLAYYSRALSAAERAQNYSALVAVAAERGITFP